MTSSATILRQRIETKDATVGVIGLGYVGLPLARAFAARGLRVLGFDTDPEKIERLRAGDSYIRAVLKHVVRDMLAAGFDPVDRPGRLAEPDVLVLCVPTPPLR